MDAQFGSLVDHLAMLKYPAIHKLRSSSDITSDDAELRIQLFEWLLRLYDPDLCKSFAHDGRVTAVARQLAVLAIGGKLISALEQLVGGHADGLLIVQSLRELCKLIDASKKEVLDWKADLEFPALASARSSELFAESLNLFAPTVQAPECASRDIATLVREMEADLRLKKQQIAGYRGQKSNDVEENASNGGGINDALQASAKSVEMSERLVNALNDFGSWIERFNEMYRTEMLSWKVEAVEPNVRVGDLASSVRQKQIMVEEFLSAQVRVQDCFSSVSEIGNQFEKLRVDEIAEESLIALEQAIAKLSRVKIANL